MEDPGYPEWFRPGVVNTGGGGGRINPLVLLALGVMPGGQIPAAGLAAYDAYNSGDAEGVQNALASLLPLPLRVGIKALNALGRAAAIGGAERQPRPGDMSAAEIERAVFEMQERERRLSGIIPHGNSNAPALPLPPAPPGRTLPNGQLAPSPAGADPHGTPLTAPIIAGRREPNGPNVPISAPELNQLLASVTGRGTSVVSPRWLGPNSRGEAVWQNPDQRRSATFDRGEVRLRQDAFTPTAAEEAAHLLVTASPLGARPTIPRALMPSLRQNYPEVAKLYQPAQHAQEYAGKAVADYMLDPAAFKQAMPQVASWVQQNLNPQKHIAARIQFNQLAPWLIAPGAVAAASTVSGNPLAAPADR